MINKHLIPTFGLFDIDDWPLSDQQFCGPVCKKFSLTPFFNKDLPRKLDWLPSFPLLTSVAPALLTATDSGIMGISLRSFDYSNQQNKPLLNLLCRKNKNIGNLRARLTAVRLTVRKRGSLNVILLKFSVQTSFRLKRIKYMGQIHQSG